MKKLLWLLIFLAMLTCMVPVQLSRFMIYIPGSREFWEVAQHEKMEVVFNDGFRFYITTHEKDRVAVSAERFNWIVKNVFRRQISDIKQIIHNHFDFWNISKMDVAFLDYMKVCGFKGKFTIWYDGMFYNY